MSIFPDDTNYRNFSHKDIKNELSALFKYSKNVVKHANKELKNYETQLDLMGIYWEIVSFAEKFLENRYIDFWRFKQKRPSLFFCRRLQKMGRDAFELDKKIGGIWHENVYDNLYSYNDIETKYYRKLRDYAITMRDLTAIGFELENRYFEDEKPLYKESKTGEQIMELYERTLKALRPW